MSLGKVISKVLVEYCEHVEDIVTKDLISNQYIKETNGSGAVGTTPAPGKKAFGDRAKEQDKMTRALEDTITK